MNSYLLNYIKTNPRFQGNEDLCEDFLAEATRRTLTVSESVDNIDYIEPYLRKVVNTSILTVLKNSGRVRRGRRDYMSVPPAISGITVGGTHERADSDRGNIPFSLDSIPDPRANFTEAVANRDLLSQVCKAVAAANSSEPANDYYSLFVKRYVEQKKQSQIASELGISQSEVCKRLYDLVKIIKNDVVGY